MLCDIRVSLGSCLYNKYTYKCINNTGNKVKLNGIHQFCWLFSPNAAIKKFSSNKQYRVIFYADYIKNYVLIISSNLIVNCLINRGLFKTRRHLQHL